MGGSIGGPVLKDGCSSSRNYEGQRQKVGTSATDTLPTNLLTETALGNDGRARAASPAPTSANT